MWWWWWIMLSFRLLRALVLRYQLSFPTFLFGGCWHWVLSLQLFSRSYHGVTTFRSYHGITYYLRLGALTFYWLINELVSHLHENYGQTRDFSDEDEHKVTDSNTTGVAYLTNPVASVQTIWWAELIFDCFLIFTFGDEVLTWFY